ncbi:MAG: pyruvate kinase [Crocinitomicaceae bacterium]|nr:pyruvate kinase [Crocinitomicaceae bacterium]|tara:strand:+ start:4444 stop:5871 length:1428 start_codon:yes stop_codon:yes gene_type:complete
MKTLKNKTKIVATIGPASAPKDTLRKLILSGVNVCRINFSHGDHETHLRVIETIRELDSELGTFTAILGDLQGPKIRIGNVEDNGVLLENGHELVITTKEQIGTKECVYITYQEFPKDVSAGEIILIDDGKLVLEVVETNKKDRVVCRVKHGGILSSKKGVNLPNTKISLPCLTPKDLKDLDFALKHQLSWIALSFVRKASDIAELKEIIQERESSARIVAKVEKPEAIDNLDEIINITDAVMVARGDLGVEIPMQDVPLIQKEIVNKCQLQAKPVIIATQMMESMIENVSPTRAEVNDVANAVMDGADAVMLSGETSVGKFPVEVIEAMYKILIKTETFKGIYHKEFKPQMNDDRFITDSVCFSAVKMQERTKAKAIITMTHSGYTAYKVSSFRPQSNIFVFTGNPKILNMLSLVWGVRGFYYDKFVSTDHTIDDIKFILKKKEFVEEDDLVINIASMPISDRGMSNMVRLSYV